MPFVVKIALASHLLLHEGQKGLIVLHGCGVDGSTVWRSVLTATISWRNLIDTLSSWPWTELTTWWVSNVVMSRGSSHDPTGLSDGHGDHGVIAYSAQWPASSVHKVRCKRHGRRVLIELVHQITAI
jgi:hypothetical protein